MKKFYDITKMAKVEADYKYLMGGRNIGKSYQVKLLILKKVIEKDSEFIYLRRYKEDMKNQLVTDYFADMNIEEITDGKYKEIYTYQSTIYLINRDEKGKPCDKKLIGRAHCLSTAEHQKSIMYPRVEDVIFEEFIPESGMYLDKEPSRLQSYISTISRTRKITVWLVGNTISKLCPYFTEWGLDKVNKQKLNTIDIYRRNIVVNTEDGIEENQVIVAVERCAGKGILSKMAFGSAAEMIANNEWSTDSKPLLDTNFIDECEERYIMYVFWANLKFKCTFLSYKGDYFWYIKPASGKLKIDEISDTRLISDKITIHKKHTNSLTPLNAREAKVFKFLTDRKIFYSDNTTGTDFENVLANI